MRPLLLGGRTAPPIKTSIGRFLNTWLPVMVMLLIIARESTSTFSSANTSGWMRAAYEAVAGSVPDWQWPAREYDIRKTGHFLGYGLLGLTWLRAWMITWLQRLLCHPAWRWRGYAVVMAVACTAVVASLDELHQSFLPDRTGLPADVMLDTLGAAALIGFCATFWIRRPWQRSIL